MFSNYYSKNRKQISFWEFFRDFLIFRAPFFFAQRFLPYSPDFIFLTHPRNQEDIYATFPFLRFLQLFLPLWGIRLILKAAPCYVVANIRGPNGRVGYVVSVTELPDKMFSSRELVRSLVKNVSCFFKRISRGDVYVGLAAWWPIVTNSGLMFQEHIPASSKIKVTNGHSATLASMYLSSLDLLDIVRHSKKSNSDRLLIIGVGKIGGGLAGLLANQVKKIGLVDKNKMRLSIVEREIKKVNAGLDVEVIYVEDKNSEDLLCRKAADYGIIACTTSNAGFLISDPSKIHDCIILDDSRPEAFPRIFSLQQRTVVLEGGLMKIPGVYIDSDFGFGQHDDVFGCLSEAIILSIDSGARLKPNVGELDRDNFFQLLEFCQKNKFTRGDFKCAHKTVSTQDLKSLVSPDKFE